MLANLKAYAIGAKAEAAALVEALKAVPGIAIGKE